MKKMVMFGAGKIGRSFIGPLFSRSGYEVVFVDINREVIGALNRRGRYEVVIKSGHVDRMIPVTGVRGVLADDAERVAEELSESDLAAVSVGQGGLPAIARLIAAGLKLRREKYGLCPLDIILAENMRDAGGTLSGWLREAFGEDFPLEEMAGLVETSIGKMVPVMPAAVQQTDPLLVYAEPYNTLIVDEKGFKNPLPNVEGLAPKENIKAWVDRKAYIHNFGHAAAAYAGYRIVPPAAFLWEVLENRQVLNFVRKAMGQSAAVLMKKHPGEFTPEALTAHIDDLLSRFRNRALGDTVFRVGCDLKRKLSRNDRILSPLIDALAFGLPSDAILQVFLDGLRFRGKDENGSMLPGDAVFAKILDEEGLPYVLEKLCGLDPVQDETVINRIFAGWQAEQECCRGGKMKTEMDRKGIISAGNWLVDNVKMVTRYPSPGNLATISRIETGLGGCSHNVLVDLSRLGTGLPLYAGGCIGRDAYGEMVLEGIARHGIDASNMTVLEEVPTSYTDVISETEGDATRTFFHYRGANARLAPAHISGIDTPARIFHLGYLLLLDELDKEDPEYGIAAARVLDGLRKKGYETSVDVVSEEGDRFRRVVVPCLPYVDYFIVNEIEAGACCGKTLRDGSGILLHQVKAAARKLLDDGVIRLVVIHFPEGGFALDRDGRECYVASDRVPPGNIVSPVGAGDAFCAGILYGIHEGMALHDMLAFANTSARFNLRSATSTGGAPTLSEIQGYIAADVCV